jgi:hypothetical protein
MTIYPPESGLVVDLSDKEHFRFENNPYYQKHLSHKYLKEMDYVFQHQGKMHFLEVKSYQKILQYRQKADLAKTLTDALLIMSAGWLQTKSGQAFLKTGIPDCFTRLQPFVLILALEFPVGIAPEFTESVDNAVKSALQGYVDLYDSEVQVLNYDKLCERFPFIERQLAL